MPLTRIASRTITVLVVAIVLLSGLSSAKAHPPARNQHFYVLNRTGKSVVILPLYHDGDIRPVVIISGPHTQITDPVGLAVDRQGVMYVADRAANSILAFAADAAGDAVPLATIHGPQTQLASPTAVALDSSGNIYVSNEDNSVEEFSRGTSGDSKPVHRLFGSSTLLDRPVGLGVDTVGRLYIANARSSSIVMFHSYDEGDTSPVDVVKGNATQLRQPTAMVVDTFGRLYVSNGDSTVLLFAEGPSGNIAPSAIATSLQAPGAVGYDPVACIYAPNFKTNSLSIYDPRMGYSKPVHVIQGSDTQINGPVAAVLY